MIVEMTLIGNNALFHRCMIVEGFLTSQAIERTGWSPLFMELRPEKSKHYTISFILDQ